MKKMIFVFAAFALSAVTDQAVACDWGVHADNKAATVVVCDPQRLRGCADLLKKRPRPSPLRRRSPMKRQALHQ